MIGCECFTTRSHLHHICTCGCDMCRPLMTDAECAALSRELDRIAMPMAWLTLNRMFMEAMSE